MFHVTPIPYQVQALIDAEIEPGERVEWTGQPIPARLAKKALPMVIFGIPWTLFALFWTGMATWGTWNGTWNSGKSFSIVMLFPLWGLPFIGVGIGLLTSPIWERRRATRTAYVLTDRRAIILSTGWRGAVKVRSFAPARLGDLQRTQNADGSGDLVFTMDIATGSRGSTSSKPVGFLGVPDVRDVENRVRQLAGKPHP